MTTPEHDTNPSTPSSKRASDPRIAAPKPAAREHGPDKGAPARPKTDPGVAPPAEPLPVPAHPMGIIVPSVAPGANDSVDVLLEGISEQSERSKTTPQTERQAAAAYHVEHAVRAPQTRRSEPPTVVIDGRADGRTPRVSPSRVSELGKNAKAWTETTEVNPPPSTARLIIAVLAGLAVVVVIFIALHLTSEGTAPALGRSTPIAPTAPALPQTVGATVVSSEAPAPASAPASPTEMPSASAPTSSASGAPSRRAAPATKPSKQPKPKPSATSTKAPGSDLGEFKSSF